MLTNAHFTAKFPHTSLLTRPSRLASASPSSQSPTSSIPKPPTAVWKISTASSRLIRRSSSATTNWRRSSLDPRFTPTKMLRSIDRARRKMGQKRSWALRRSRASALSRSRRGERRCLGDQPAKGTRSQRTVGHKVGIRYEGFEGSIWIIAIVSRPSVHSSTKHLTKAVCC